MTTYEVIVDESSSMGRGRGGGPPANTSTESITDVDNIDVKDGQLLFYDSDGQLLRAYSENAWKRVDLRDNNNQGSP